MAFTVSDATANAAVNAVSALLNNGYLKIYAGTQPTDANTAVGVQTLLATLRWNATAFAGASAGVAVANAITSDTNAAASGTATWFRALKSDNSTVVFDGTVGTSGSTINLGSVAISSGATVSVTSYTLTLPE